MAGGRITLGQGEMLRSTVSKRRPRRRAALEAHRSVYLQVTTIARRLRTAATATFG
jgi:hypothetical protein